ncbi:hypothetical protein ACO1O0_002550 [Amphichorda felina]
MATERYPVYKVKEDLALPDPHMPPGRLHHSIFVKTNDDGSGIPYNVIGDITSRGGMTYECRGAQDPFTSDSLHSKELLGYTPVVNQRENWDDALRSLPTPPQQKASNPQRVGQVEPFKERLESGGFVFYKDGEERQPLWKCTEWTEQYAIPTLLQRGLLQPEDSAVGTSNLG